MTLEWKQQRGRGSRWDKWKSKLTRLCYLLTDDNNSQYQNEIQTTRSFFVRFQILTATSNKIRAFWDVAQSLVIVDRRFRGTYCLYHLGDEILPTASITPDLRGSRHLWNVWSSPTRLHDATSQWLFSLNQMFLFKLIINEVTNFWDMAPCNLVTTTSCPYLN
jgi:hypothetical protein